MLKNTSSNPCKPPSLEPILEQLLAIRADVLSKENQACHFLEKVHPHNWKSAKNLLQYLAFRTHDLRELQLKLSEWGLSSLGRAERKVHATMDAVLRNLHHFARQPFLPEVNPPFCHPEGRQLLEDNATQVFGPPDEGHRSRIMVTMPTEAASDYHLVKNLLSSGMNCARINCAHDDSAVWKKIINNIRKAERTLKKDCKVLMDLGGPKLRTGNLQIQPEPHKIRPQRNAFGEVVTPAKIWIHPLGTASNPSEDVTVSLAMAESDFQKLRPGDRILLKDTRKAKRKLTVVFASEGGCLATSRNTIYLVGNTPCRVVRNRVKIKKLKPLLEVPAKFVRSAINLEPDDQLLLTRSQEPGQNAQYNDQGHLVSPAKIPCQLPQVFADVRPGEPIWFDDGKIGGVIQSVDKESVAVTIQRVPPGGGVLRSEKGINLPDTDLHLPALTSQDKANLKFVVEHADMVGLSFANQPADVEELITEMKNLKPKFPDVVLKIETQTGFKNLPAMLLAAMQAPNCGVMIARGDLAIECGFGRLSEVQEQVLWICEAAHVPVIWATQVLEGLAKTGLPTRAEVTDAAMGQRAECIMLNKGPHIVEATKALSDILTRMQDHQTKKRSLLRKLRLAEHFFEQATG